MDPEVVLAQPAGVGPPRGLSAVLRGRLRAIVRGRAGEAAWARVAMVGIGLLAAVVYVWNLTISGYANIYYSGAALAGSQSWSAWFFGSLDSSNFITVDKPPLAVMLMGVSVRIFGLSSWSILLPEALLGVASVLLLFSLVRRTFGPAAAVIAALVMALTPAAVLIFRYDNPDALLTSLLIAGAWAMQRSLEAGRVRWLVLAAVFVGLGFNAKFLQADLVLPAFVLTWLIAAPVSFSRRVMSLIPMAIAGFIASFWWVGIVALIPAAARPFIGGSTDGSAIQLLFGYDGLGRIFGQGGGPGGDTGPLRLFDAAFGDQIAWLAPLALICLLAGLVCSIGRPRTDPRRASFLLWGGWLLVTATVFSLMSGIIHPYYTVVLAPAIGALVGAGIVELWQMRERMPVAGLVLAAGVAANGVVAAMLLARLPRLSPGASLAMLAGAAAAALIVAVPPGHLPRFLGAGALAGAIGLLLIPPAGYAISALNTGLSGSDPRVSLSIVVPALDHASRADAGPAEGPLGALAQYLVAHRGQARWIAAVENAPLAAAIELATKAPVMAMGGFRGSDPAISVHGVAEAVRAGQLRFVILESRGLRPTAPTPLERWLVAKAPSPQIVGTFRLYDLAGLSSERP